MRKYFLTALVALLAAPCFAQYGSPLHTSDNGKFTFDILDHFGVGYNIVNTDDYTPNGSTDVFLNVAEIGLYPTKNFGLEVGVDLQFNAFYSKETAFAQVDKIIKPVAFSALGLGDNFDRKRGCFSVFGLGAPVLLKGSFGNFQIGVGGIASWNITADNDARLRKDNRRLIYEESSAKANPFSYCFLGTLSYEEIGAYIKYNPKSSRLLPDGSIDMSFITLGVFFKM